MFRKPWFKFLMSMIGCFLIVTFFSGVGYLLLQMLGAIIGILIGAVVIVLARDRLF